MKAMNFKETIIQAKPKIGSMDAILDELYGKVGSPEREEFRKEAHALIDISAELENEFGAPGTPERDKFDEEAYTFYLEETD